MTIEFVYFDADGTLFDLDATLTRALHLTLTELRRLVPGPATTALTVEALQADRDVVAAELRGVEFDLARIRLAAFTRTIRRCGVADPEALAERITAYFLQHRFAGSLVFPEVPAALDELAAKYRIGVLSNGNSHPDRCGLAGRFESVVLAQDHGVEKPDRRLYDIAATAVGLPPERIAMVGDSLDDDVAGAQLAGWRGIWLNRTGACPPDGFRPDTVVATLSDVSAALDRGTGGEMG